MGVANIGPFAFLKRTFESISIFIQLLEVTVLCTVSDLIPALAYWTQDGQQTQGEQIHGLDGSAKFCHKNLNSEKSASYKYRQLK
jgi:hypothetical protein